MEICDECRQNPIDPNKTFAGEARGWICGHCNTGMGSLQDDIPTLARAIIWIKNLGKGKN